MSSDLEIIAAESAKGGFFLIVGGIIAIAISAVASIFVARFLGPELYGQYALSLVLPQLLFLFTDFGISQGLIKFSASLKQKGEMKNVTRIIKHGIFLRVVAGFGIFSGNFLLADFFATAFFGRPDLVPYIQIASFSILFQVLFSTATSAYVGLDKSQYSAFMTNIQAASKSAVSIILVLAGFGIIGALIGHVVGFAVSGVLGLIALVIMLQESAKQTTNKSMNIKDSLQVLMTFGIPLYISALLVGFITPYQNLILGIFTSNVDIGNFKAAFNFITLIMAISISITTTLLSAFSKLNSSSKKDIQSLFMFANKYTTMTIIPFIILIVILSKQIVQLVYGSTYQTADLFLSIYCLIYFLVGMGSLSLPSLFNGLGETKITLKQSLINFAILIPLVPILTNLFSVFGSIVGLLAAKALSTCYGVYVAKNLFHVVFDTKILIKIYSVAAILSIIPFLFVHVSPWPLLFNVVGGSLLYFFMYLTFAPLAGLVNRSELKALSKIAQKMKPLNKVIEPLLKYEEKIIRAARKDALKT